MKGDFTRSTFRPDKHYSSVRMQQGRLQLDADWNEQVDIQTYLRQTQLEDVIGLSGVSTSDPDNANAFKITPDGQDFKITPGRIYVDGILCELEKEISYKNQPDYPNALKGDLDDKLDAGFYLAYLDVWERHITAIEDPDIREVALNGVDTATRTKTVCQVKLIQQSKWENLLKRQKAKLIAAKVSPEISLENHLYRIEIHQSENVGTATFKWSRDNGAVVSAIEKIKDNTITVSQYSHNAWLSSQPGQWIEILDEEQELSGKPGTLTRLESVYDNQLIFDKARILGEPIPPEYQKSPNEPRKLKVRRWDYTTETTEAGIAIETTADEIPLENEGITIKFLVNSDSYFQTGDYWLIPTRAITNAIEWPQDRADPPNYLPQPPQGIEHHYCLLALLEFKDGRFEPLNPKSDRRTPFVPLTRCLDKDNVQALKLNSLTIGVDQELARLYVKGAQAQEAKENGTISPSPANDNDVRVDIDFRNLLHPGDTIIVGDQTRIVQAFSEDFSTLTLNAPFGNLSEGTPFKYQQPIARFDNGDDVHSVTISAKGNVGIGTLAPSEKLEVNGNIKAGSLELTGTFAGDMFAGRRFQLQNPSDIAYGSIEAEKSGENRKFSFKAENEVNFAFLGGNVNIEKNLSVTGDSTLSGTLKLREGVEINKFSNEPLGNSSATVPTEVVIKNYADTKASLGGSADRDFQTKDLKVSGNLTLQQGESINKFSKGDLGDSTTVVPTEKAVKDYVDEKIEGSSRRNFQTRDLKVNGNLTLAQGESINKFSKDDLGSTTTTVPTEKVVKDYVDEKIQGSSRRNFQTKDLKVNGNLTLAQGESINKFSKDDLGDSTTVVPTEKAVKDYVDGRIGGSSGQDLQPKNLTATGNLTALGAINIGEGQLARLQVQGASSKDANATSIEPTQIVSNELLAVGDTITLNNQKSLIIQVNGNTFTVSPPFHDHPASASFQYQQPIARFLDSQGQAQLTVTATGTVVVGSFTVDTNDAPITPDSKLYVNGSVFAKDITAENRLSQLSSRELKENITQLSSREVTQLLKQLNPVKFSYKTDRVENLHVGFISEEVPDLVASPDKKAVSPLDIVAILTKAVQDHRHAVQVLAKLVEQQNKEIAMLKEKVQVLEERN